MVKATYDLEKYRHTNSGSVDTAETASNSEASERSGIRAQILQPNYSSMNMDIFK